MLVHFPLKSYIYTTDSQFEVNNGFPSIETVDFATTHLCTIIVGPTALASIYQIRLDVFVQTRENTVIYGISRDSTVTSFSLGVTKVFC